jgi:hypothetical protein
MTVYWNFREGKIMSHIRIFMDNGNMVIPLRLENLKIPILIFPSSVLEIYLPKIHLTIIQPSYNNSEFEPCHYICTSWDIRSCSNSHHLNLFSWSKFQYKFTISVSSNLPRKHRMHQTQRRYMLWQKWEPQCFYKQGIIAVRRTNNPSLIARDREIFLYLRTGLRYFYSIHFRCI